MTVAFPSYFVVGDTNPTTQVWDTFAGAMVVNTNAGYLAWVAAGGRNGPSFNQVQVTNVANNGSGNNRLTVNTTGEMANGDAWVTQNTGTAADGTATVTVINSTTVDLSSAFVSGGAVSGAIDRGVPIGTMAALLQGVNAYNASLWISGNFLGSNTPSGGADVTLTNPMVDVQNCSFTVTGKKLILPQMNVPGSIPIGMPIFILNNSFNINGLAMGVYANDGTTQIGQNLPFGLSMILTLRDNSTANGLFTPGVRGLTNDAQAAWNVARGGTGNQTLTAHGFLIGAGTAPLNVTAAPTDGQLPFGQTGGDPALATITGDVSVNKTGVSTLASVIAAAGPVGDASHIPQITYDAKGRLTTVTTVAVAIDAGAITSGTLGVPRGGTGVGALTQHGILLGEGSAAIAVTAAMSDGQLLVGQTSADPLPKTITGDVTFTAAGVSALGNVPNDTVMAGDLLATNSTAPSTPASGKSRIYVDSTSKNLAVKNDAGTVNHGVQTKASVASNFLTAIDADGTVHAAQPAIGDLTAIANNTLVGNTSGGSAAPSTVDVGAWDTYTVTLTANSGSFTTASASGRKKQVGKMMWVRIKVSITTVGTGSYPIVTLPATAESSWDQPILGRELLSTSKICNGLIGFPDFGKALIAYYDGTDPAASGREFDLLGCYEVA